MSPLWTHSLLTRHAGSAPPGPIRTVSGEKLILKLFRNEVVPVRSSALRSKGNDRKTKCVPKCRNTHHSGQIPFSSGRNTLLGSIRGETVKQSPAEAARQAGRLVSGGGGGTTTHKKKKSLEFLWGAGRISWFLQQQQTGLQRSDDFLPCAPPALQLTDLEQWSWAGRR